ncbi:hypothetical protein BM221_003751 [Beauveria bassiana]|uniref:Uncharacterized protein n=1 Tax=Beauveria bassiana TaxID=176275 RepID=A0A2N6NVI1_BEABA|nr:hypothetical protein BM221_003751 [Beauveria bassiana]
MVDAWVVNVVFGPEEVDFQGFGAEHAGGLRGQFTGQFWGNDWGVFEVVESKSQWVGQLAVGRVRYNRTSADRC